MKLQGRVALVTGGGSGIGRATAFTMAREGARVAVLSLSQENLDKIAAEIRAEGGEAIGIRGDITRPDELRAAVEKVEKTYGRLDTLFANAGINGTWAPVDDLTPEEWGKIFSVNLEGTVHTVQAAIPAMKRAGGGAVVITSSVNGTRLFSNPGAWAYGLTKAAQVALAKFMAAELAPHRIRVNAVCPGRIETAIQGKGERRNIPDVIERIPLTDDKGAEPEEVARLVTFLCSDEARFITGTEVYIDGAQTLAS